MERINYQPAGTCSVVSVTCISNAVVPARSRKNSKSLLSFKTAVSFFILLLIVGLLPQSSNAQPCSWFGSSGVAGNKAVSPGCGYPNGAGGTFTYNVGESNQTIALRACESVYGVGNCVVGSCGNFTYYYRSGHLTCNCSKSPGQYEFIFSNTGYTQVGQDYGGQSESLALPGFNGGSTFMQNFTRVKYSAGCDANSWRLTQQHLGQQLVGSGTFTYANLVRGARYEISTCGSPFDTQLSIYDATPGWTNRANNNDNGPFCSGTNASIDFTAQNTNIGSTEGNHLLVVNRFNCQGHDFTGQSALLRYRQIPPVINSSSATMCAGGTRALSADQNFGTWAGYGVCNQLTFQSYGGVGLTSTAGVNGSTFFSNITAPASWSSGYYSAETFTRNQDMTLYFRYHNSTNANMMIGWHGNSIGGSYPDLLYCFYFHTSGLQIYEDGNFRGDFNSSMPGGWQGNIWWECRIDLKAAGATYYLRRLGEGSTWYMIYQSGYSSESGLRVGWAQHSGTTNVEGIRISGPGVGFNSGVCSTYNAGLDWRGDTFSGWQVGGDATHTFTTGAPTPMNNQTVLQINPNNNTWNDYVHTTATYTRLANEEITFKYYNGANVWNMIGWHGYDRLDVGGGSMYTNMTHALYFAGDNGFHIYEDGNFRTSFTPPGGASLNTWWEGRIVLKSTGADYYLRRLGNCTWTLVYSGSYSSETNLRAGWTSYGTGTAYIDDIQVQGSTTLTTTVYYGQSECTATQSINVNPAPVVSLTSNAASACQGTPVTFTACSYTGTFTTVDYTFRLGGTAVLQSGASNTYVSTSNPATSAPGTYNIDVVATSSSGCSRSSNFVTLVVNANPTTSITCSNCISGNIFCFGPGYTATLNANASPGCGSILSYQWYLNGSPVAGGGAQFIASTPGNYQVVVTNNCVPNCSTTSATFTLVQNPQIVVNAGADRILCPVPPGNSTTLGGSPTASGGTPGYSYAWSPSTALSSTTSANPTVTNLTTTTNYTVTVTDSRGCTATDNVLVQVLDVTPPTISCVQTSVTRNDDPGVCYSNFTPANPTISDNCSATTLTWTLSGATSASSPSSGINYVGNTNFFTGVTTVTYTVRDQTGNSATCSYTITVIDNQNPTVTCPANITRNNDLDQCGAVVTYGGSASDNCSIASGFVSPGLPSGSFFPVGVTTNVFNVSDPSGNTATCSFTVTVLDVQNPTINCPANITQSADPGGCSAVVNYTVSASDNCPGVTTQLIQGNPSGSSFPTGAPTTVRWRATDAKGNTATCSFTVTIFDGVPPVITCPSNITVFNSIGFCGANVSYSSPSSSDNCGDVIVVQTAGLASGSFFAVGTTTNVFKSTDESGNTATCSFTVTVVDNKPPTALCKNITINLSTAGSATIVASDINNGSSDECGVASLSASKTTFGCSDVGNNTVILTVTDVNGNTSTCSSTVTVRDVTPPVAVCQNITRNLSSSSPGSVSITPSEINNGSSDACGITLSLSRTAFTCADAFAVAGNQTVTLTVTDPSGNTATCTATVRINDVTNPTALCKNITIQLDATGNKTIAHNATDNGSFDNCSIVYSLSKTSYTCANVGSNAVTLTVTDPTGLTATCSSTVTVQDVTPPTAICKNITVNLSAAGTATTAHNAINNGSTDACGIASFTSSKTSWNCSNVGNNTVTLTVTDVNGNSSTCTGTVTIRDVTPPNAICKNITVQLDATGNVSITAAQVDNGSNDACGVASLAVFPTSFNCTHTIQYGMQQAVLTVTDVNGNQNTCIANVEVQDNVPPVALCKNYTIELDFAGNATVYPTDINNGSNDACGIDFLGITATLSTGSFTNASEVFVGCDDVDPSPNPVVLVVTDDNGNTSTCNATVTVLDNMPPILECFDVNKFNDPGVCQAYVSIPPVNIYDNCVMQGVTITNDGNGNDGNDASGIYPVGVTTVTWTVTDAFGNTETCSFDVTVTDNEKPTSMDPPNQFFVTNPGVCYASAIVQPLLNVNDNCGVASVVNSYTGTNNASGNYPDGISVVIWTITDIHGNVTTKFQFIAVIDLEQPVLVSGTCPGPITVNTDPGRCDADVTLTAPQYTDNCGIGLILATVNNAVINGSHDRFNLGTTTIVWKAQDIHANYNQQCSQTITVVDNQNPVITCPANINKNTDPNQCQAAVSIPTPTWSDNCSVASVTNTRTGVVWNASGTYALGTTTITYTATDGSGNTSTCSFTVTVTDNQLPSITCPSSVTKDTDPGMCTAAVSFAAPTASDNCGISTVLNNFNGTGNASGTYPVGTTTVIWTATDVNGNTRQCTHSVTVNDNEDPTVTCPADAFESVDAGQCGAVVSIPQATADDNCGVDVVINDYNGTDNATDYYPVGTTTVTWIVVDVHGLVGFCSQNVTVVDDEAPSITCAAAQTQSVDAGQCQANVTVTGPAYSDNCAVDFFLNDYTGTDDASGDYPVGTTQITWIILDIYGNVNLCTQDITVVDDELPAIDCADDQTQTADPGDCQAAVTVAGPVTGDNCGVDLFFNDKTGSQVADDIYPVGTTIVTWTVVDVNGNVSTCTQAITVTDDEAPTFICAGNQTHTADAGVCNAAVTVNPPYAASDNCGIASVLNSFNGTDDASGTYPVGTTTVTWTVTDVHGNTTTCEQNITITDDEAPSITCAANQTHNTDPGLCTANVTVVAPSFGDNCPGSTIVNDLTNTSSASGVYAVGTTTLTWTVTDAHGHSVSCTQTITVEDHQNPSITCAPNQTQTADAGVCEAVVTVNGPSTGDNCGVDDVVNNYTGTSDASDTYPVGTTTVTWTVTDIYGNSSQCVQTITVTDNENPVIACPPNMVVNTDPNVCQAAVTVPVPATGDNCAVASLVNNRNGLANASGTYPLGTTTVKWTVTDIHGNSATCSITIQVRDVQNPAITCPPNKVANNTFGLCEATVVIAMPSTSDNCGVASVVNNYNTTNNASDTYPVGVTTVTYTVTDVNSNSSTCSFTVTIHDVQPPAISCQADVSVDADLGECGAFIDVPIPSYSDNCDVDTIINDYTGRAGADDVYPVGTTVLLWTAIDESGNTSTCIQRVTVTDNQDPSITCEPGMLLNSDPGECGAEVTVISPAFGDNCGVASLVNSFNGTNDASGFYPVGITTILWTVTDIHGRHVSCNQVITITDEEAPQIACPSNITQTADPTRCNAAVFIAEPLASDNCAIDELMNDKTGTDNASAVYNVGVTTVTYFIRDIHDNWNTCQFTVTITDNEAPSITCPASVTVSNDGGACSAYVGLPSAGSTDNCGFVTVTNNRTGTSNASDTYPVGTTTVTFTSTDVHGNSSTCNVTVTVNDTEHPQITCPADITQTADAGECEAGVSVPAPSTSDNCGVAGRVNDYNGTSDASDDYPVGSTTVEFTVTDIYGNTTACSFTVTITDDEEPLITCPANITQTADAGECEADVIVPVPVVSDNCAVDEVLNDYTWIENASADYPVGTTTVLYAVIDIHGNDNFCTFTVTVTDDEDPTIICPANQVVNTDPNVCTRALTISIPGTDDNCGVASVVNSKNGTNNASGTYSLGTTTVTYTVTDIHGNSTTCSFTVTVNDQQVPTITCPGDIIISSDPGACSAYVAVPVPPAYGDNCTVVSVLNDYNGGADASDTYPVGVTIVEWTATDQSGNATDCSMSILVFDDEDPVIHNCPSDINVVAQPGDCNPQVFWTEPTATDNCSYTLSSNYHPGDRFDVDPGSYAVNYIAVDPSGNTATCNFVVNVDPTPLVVTHVKSQFACGHNISCNGKNDGSIDLTVNGACLPYTYAWTGPGGFSATTQDISGLVAGTYCYTVTDSRLQGYPGNGQSASGCITLTEPALLTASGVVPTFACGYQISCNGANDGSIDVTVNGGCAPYIYTWVTPNGSGLTPGAQDQSGLSAGTYKVTIQDQNNCSVVLTFILTQPAPVVITDLSSPTYPGGGNVSCAGVCDGSISLEVDGGADCLPYSYLWSGPPQTITTTTTTTTNTTVTGSVVDVGNGNGNSSSSGGHSSGGGAGVCNTSGSSNVIGAADGSYADFDNIGDKCVFELGHELPAGTIFTIRLRQEPGQAGTSTFKVYESQYGVLFASPGTTVSTTNETWFNQAVTTSGPTRYVMLEATSSSDFDVDAITYSFVKTTTVTTTSTTTTGPFSSTSEDLSGLCAGTYCVTITDANGCSVSQCITLNSAAPIQTGICNNQTVVFGYYPENVAQITTNASGGTAPYTYLWSTGETTSSIVVAPTATTTYTVTITDAVGCSAVGTHTVTVIDVRCGSSLDRVSMCDLGAKTQCLKADDVPSKLAAGWKLGSCPGMTLASLNGGNCGQPTLPNGNCNICSPSGHIKLMLVKYLGPSGATVRVRNYPQQNTFQIFTNVQNGQELVVNGTYNHGSKLDYFTYLEVVGSGAPYALLPTDCNNGHGADIVGRTYGPFRVLGLTDMKNNTCGMPTPCLCSGGIAFLGLIYNGAAGGTINAYMKSGHVDQLGTYSNLQPGDTIIVRSDVLNKTKLNSTTFFEVVGFVPDLEIQTNCGDYLKGMTYGPLTVFGWIDKDGGLCNMAPQPACPCNGGISRLTLEFDRYDSLSVTNATLKFWADAGHTTLIATFTGVNPGSVLTVNATGLPGGIFPSLIYVQIVGVSRPDIKLSVSCADAEDLIGSFVRELFVQGYVDAQGHSCDNTCGVGKTLMCHTSGSRGPHTHCVKNKDVSKKLQSGGWSLGPCPAHAKEIPVGEDGFALTAQPNPFSETTTISFRMVSEERVSLVVYNVAGEEVARLFEGLAKANELYSFEFKAGQNPDGMYFYRLVTEAGDVYIRKLVLAKQ